MGIFQQIAPHAVHHCCTEEQLLSGHSQSSGWAWILDDDVFDEIPYPARRLIACLVAIGLESRCNPLPCPAALAITVDGISLPDLLRDTFEVRDPQEPDEYKGLTHAILDSCSGFDFLLAEIDHKPGFDCVASRLCHPHSLDNTPTTDNDLRLDNWTYNGPLQSSDWIETSADLALHWAQVDQSIGKNGTTAPPVSSPWNVDTPRDQNTTGPGTQRPIPSRHKRITFSGEPTPDSPSKALGPNFAPSQTTRIASANARA
jgi:hypothetical protein